MESYRKQHKTLKRDKTQKRYRSLKRQRTFWKKENLTWLGSGSFGTIYEISYPEYTRAIKIHSLRKGIETCDDWKKEYLLQKEAHALCSPTLHKYNAYIARPYTFSYGSWNTHTETLTNLKNYKDATACYFTMERIFGRLPETEHKENIYNTIVPGFKTKVKLPPYLFTGALQYQITPNLNIITLDMMADTELIEFQRETLNYCNPYGMAENYLKNITSSFFTFIENGFLPRDIEFLFDSSGKIAIIDFNEVRKFVIDKEIPIQEIAQIYIDLCGIRNKSDKNPYHAADEPTPQWKFLCNPHTSPRGFCMLMENYPLNSWQSLILQEVLYYAKRNLRIPLSIVADWEPLSTVFTYSTTPIIQEFDIAFQKYIVTNLCELIQQLKLEVPVIKDLDYETAITVLNNTILRQDSVNNLDMWENNPMWQ